MCCSILQCSCKSSPFYVWHFNIWYIVTATHCNTLQHTATHCNTLQHTATHCNTLQHTATHRGKKGQFHLDAFFCIPFQYMIYSHCNTLQHTATHCNTLQHTATHCSTPQHTLIRVCTSWHIKAQYDRFHWICYTLEIHHVKKLKFFSTNSNSTNSEFEFVPQDTKESEFLDLVIFRDVAISVETVVSHVSLGTFAVCCSMLQCVAVCCSVLQCVAVCCSISWSKYTVRCSVV